MTLVRRTAASKGKCKLAFNKAYKAEIIDIAPSDADTYKYVWRIGVRTYPIEFFMKTSNQAPKPKPRLVHDSATGKLKVEHKAKPNREDVIAYIKANGGVNMPAYQLLGYLILEGVL